MKTLRTTCICSIPDNILGDNFGNLVVKLRDLTFYSAILYHPHGSQLASFPGEMCVESLGTSLAHSAAMTGAYICTNRVVLVPLDELDLFSSLGVPPL